MPWQANQVMGPAGPILGPLEECFLHYPSYLRVKQKSAPLIVYSIWWKKEWSRIKRNNDVTRGGSRYL
jgi:hypothetical protein